MKPEHLLIVCSIVVFTVCGPAEAQQPAAAPAGPLTGVLNINASLADGTQSQNTISELFVLSFASRRESSHPQRTRARLESSYATAQKVDQPRIVTGEMIFVEARHDVEVGTIGTTSPTRVWLYGVGSVYHHIAFGLRSQQGYGGGIFFDIGRVSGLAVGGDIRYIEEHFDGQGPLTSLGTRLHQSYSHIWTAGTGANVRSFVLAETFEVLLPFESKDAVHTRTGLTLSVPIVNQWSMPISLGHDYMRNAAPSAKRTYWKSTLGVTYTFAP